MAGRGSRSPAREGDRPLRGDELSLRVGQLGSAGTRHRLAVAARRAVETANGRHPPLISTRLRRPVIRENEDLLLTLADRLGNDEPLRSRGPRDDGPLVNDHSSPMYRAGASLRELSRTGSPPWSAGTGPAGGARAVGARADHLGHPRSANRCRTAELWSGVNRTDRPGPRGGSDGCHPALEWIDVPIGESARRRHACGVTDPGGDMPNGIFPVPQYPRQSDAARPDARGPGRARPEPGCGEASWTSGWPGASTPRPASSSRCARRSCARIAVAARLANAFGRGARRRQRRQSGRVQEGDKASARRDPGGGRRSASGSFGGSATSGPSRAGARPWQLVC